MYDAKLHPMRLIKTLTTPEIMWLYVSINTIVNESYRARRTVNCKMSKSLLKYGKYDTLVYNKKKCPAGHLVETFKDTQKRMVHWVPTIQN